LRSASPARAVVFSLIGIFVTKAAIDFDPEGRDRLDGAPQKLAGASYGPYLLGLSARSSDLGPESPFRG
jgi:hypothetical protein